MVGTDGHLSFEVCNDGDGGDGSMGCGISTKRHKGSPTTESMTSCEDVTSCVIEQVQEEKEMPTPPKSKREQCLAIVESGWLTSFMILVTIYALYSDDSRVLFFDKPADPIFVVCSSIAFFLFLAEIIIQCWCREDYLPIPDWKQCGCESLTKCRKNWSTGTPVEYKEKFYRMVSKFYIGSFYFWLDVIASLSMILELPWVTSLAAGLIDGDLDNSAAGRASRAGAKAARVIRVVRMVRLVRMVKLYKYLSEDAHYNAQKGGKVVPEYEELSKMPPESHIGSEISGRTTKKCIIGILIMLVVIPLFQVDSLEYVNEFGMHLVLQERTAVHENYGDSSNMLDIDDKLVNLEFTENYFIETTDCIELKYIGFDDDFKKSAEIPSDRIDPDKLRPIEKTVLIINDTSNGNQGISAVFDASDRAEEEAFLGLLLTTFVMFLLVVGTMIFSRDVNHLVILPIEKMVQLVQEISANPLGKNIGLSQEELNASDDDMETTLLLRTISKIAGLMRVGFGEAGAEIIGKNLSISKGGSSVNVLGNGTKILSIFGFCDVRDFTTITECLQEEVMLFVNRIAHLLHSVVVQCDGAANKNIGDAFLLTWKLNPKRLGSCEDNGYAGDKALYSFLKTMIEMNRHEDFICNFSPSSLGCLYDKLPRFKCRIGCGLHFGWAIEGAIGSDKKIDASYISPHVNMAEFLESSTKQYGVPILLSEPFFKLLSPEVTKYCRKIDNIKKKETDDVTALYTYDADLDLKFGKIPRKLPGRTCIVKDKRRTVIPLSKSRKTQNHRQKKRIERLPSLTTVLEEAPEIHLPPFDKTLWEYDNEMIMIRKHISNEIRKIWDIGIQAFIDGNWTLARSKVEDVLALTRQDGPALHLMQRMKEYGFVCPPDWNGYRKLYVDKKECS